MKLGSRDWRKTAEKIQPKSSYWAEALESIAEIMEAAIEVHKQWHLIPIIGSSAIADVNLGSLTFSNPHARRLTLHGLVNVGQLFRTNEAGHVTAANMKTMAELQAEYDPNMTYIMMGSLAKLARDIKTKYRLAIQQGTQMQMNKTVLVELIKKHPKGWQENAGNGEIVHVHSVLFKQMDSQTLRLGQPEVE